MEAKLPTEEQIRYRAYELYTQRGCQDGYDMDDWLQAEYELVQLPIRKIAELPPPAPKDRHAKKSLFKVVQIAMLLGAEALSSLNH